MAVALPARVQVSLNVLVVDDDAFDREAVRRHLGDVHRVEEAATARRARALLDEGARPDLVLLDYRLPDAEGIELLPEFDALGVPVIMLTGLESAEVIVESMRGGAQGYLVKGTLTRDGLRRAVEDAVEKAALQRAVAEQQAALARQAEHLEEQNAEIRSLAAALALAEQAERRRISNLLHDHLQQLLFGAKLAVESLRPKPRDAGGAGAPGSGAAGAGGIGGRLDEAVALLDEGIEMARRLAVDLTPPVLDEEELSVGLEWLASHMGRLYEMDIHVRTEVMCVVEQRDLRVLLLQLVRELLFNVAKHARATHITVALLRCGPTFEIRVEDDGVGFDMAQLRGKQSGFGLYSVRERLELIGGRLEVDSRPGRGTRATVCLPTGHDAAGPAFYPRGRA